MVITDLTTQNINAVLLKMQQRIAALEKRIEALEAEKNSEGE